MIRAASRESLLLSGVVAARQMALSVNIGRNAFIVRMSAEIRNELTEKSKILLAEVAKKGGEGCGESVEWNSATLSFLFVNFIALGAWCRPPAAHPSDLESRWIPGVYYPQFPGSLDSAY